MVRVVVFLGRLAEVLQLRCDFEDMSNGVKLVSVEVTEGFREVCIWGDELGIPKALVYPSEVFEDYPKPRRAVEGRIWCSKGGRKGLAETLDCMEGGSGIF